MHRSSGVSDGPRRVRGRRDGEALVPGSPAVPFAEFACQAGDETVDSETDSEAIE